MKNLMMIAVGFLLAWPAQAQSNQIQTERVLGKTTVNGNQLVTIRQILQQKLQEKGQRLEDFQLEGVTLLAKSWGGNATATMRVGQDQQVQNIPRAKNFAFYLLNEPLTFHRLTWDLRQAPGQPNEVWQMQLRGNIEVRALEVHLSQGAQRIRINLNDELYTQNSTLMLRQELQKMGIQSQNLRLRSVTLVAKSMAGQAQAQLRVGQRLNALQTIDRAPFGYTFQDTNPQSYNRLQWQESGPTPGAWQIEMRGRVRVKAVILEVR